jgi:signal transduction histidine kinase/FixJ family two-component response regulator
LPLQGVLSEARCLDRDESLQHVREGFPSMTSASALQILLIDDDQVDRLAVRRALASAELEVELREVPNAVTGVGAIHQSSFDCVLLDYRLPDRDGVQVLRQLRAEGIQTPVIMLTGHGDELLAVELMKAGASDYIPKSQMTGPGLAQAIRQAVRIHRLEQEARRAASAHAQQLRSLAEAAAELAPSLSAEQLCERVARRARSILFAEVAEVRLLPDVAGAPGSPGDLKPLLQRLERAQRAEGAGLEEARADIAAAGLTAPTTSWLAAPLVAADGVTIGLIHACDKAQRRFTDDDESILVQLAQMASVALQNIALLRAAEQAARARDDLVSVVSHDLRNPLNTIAMGLTILERSPDLDAHQGVIARLRRGASRLDRIIADLLDVTRIESGTLAVDPRPIAPSNLLDEVVDLLGPQAQAKGQMLDVSSPPHAPMVLADRDRVMQVFLNLVGNAIKFTPDGGLVAVSAARHGDGVRFEVRDTGPGIPAHDVPHVFDRFWQARSTARMGTGLGLFIAKGIIDAHGGKLHVESAEGLGTSISFTLAAATEADRHEKSRESSESLIAPRVAFQGRATA